MSLSKATLLAAAILLTSVNAHMKMKTPKPFAFDDESRSRDPLQKDGSDFPCKQRPGAYNNGTSTTIPIGVSQTLSFTGSAVHGGGSCQISLSSDKQPSKSSQWQVIHSIEGGCPSSATGNLPDNPNGSDAGTFQYSIPEGITPGEYTLAWTWFNNVGNREMYMNCAPVTVTGGSKKRDTEIAVEEEQGFTKRATSFPAMFQANIGNGCTTVEKFDVQFPEPGNSVEISAGAKLGPPIGNCGSSGSSSGGSAAAAQGPAPVASSAAAPSITPIVAPSGSAPAPSTYTILASSAAPAVVSPVAASPVASAAPTVVSPPSGSSTGSSLSGSSSSGGGRLTGTCSTEGQFNCVGGSSFQQCSGGSWSVVQPMATGTKCAAGQELNLNITFGKRHHRFARGHVRRGQPLGSW